MVRAAAYQSARSRCSGRSWAPGRRAADGGGRDTRSQIPMQRRQQMEVFIFARFHARPGSEGGVADALLDVLAPSREEPGCLSIHAFRSTRDPQLFYIHSRWKD